MSRNDLPNEKAPNFNARIRETLMTYLGKTGDPLDRGVTMRDLIESGIVNVDNQKQLTQNGPVTLVPGSALATSGADYVPDLTAPPTPEGITVSGGVAGVFIEHEKPIFSQGHGYLRTHVYGLTVAAGDPAPTFNDAVEITQFTGSVGSFASDPATTWHVWLKYESIDGVLSASPAGGTNGIEVTTAQNVSSLLAALTSEVDTDGNPVNPDAVFIKRDAESTINGVVVPAGVYMRDTFIQNGVIDNARLGNAVVDAAKIIDGSIITAKIGDAAVITAKIEDAAITTAKIKDAAITSAKIVDASITAAKIADATITSAEIADAAITFAKIDKASIDSLSAITESVGQINMQRPAGQATFIRFGKTSVNDVANAGFWIGVDSTGVAGVAIGGSNGLFKYSASAGLQVAGQSVSVTMPGAIVSSGGASQTYTWTNNTGLYTVFTLKMIGGGGGGAGQNGSVANAAGGAGGTTSATVRNSAGSVVNTYSAAGGAGGAAGGATYSGTTPPPLIRRSPVIISNEDGAAGTGGYYYYGHGWIVPDGGVGGYLSTNVTIPLNGSISVTVGAGGYGGSSLYNGTPGYAGAFSLTVVG